MNTKQFKYAVILDEEGSFTTAAEKLGITQPSLSQYIRKLENEMGYSLFIRRGHKVVTTPQGRIFVRYARKILYDVRQMNLEFNEMTDSCKANIRIGVSHSRSAGRFSKVVGDFCKENPSVTVSIYEKTVKELEKGVCNGEFDICIFPYFYENENYRTMELYDEKVVFAIPSSIAVKLALDPPKDGIPGTISPYLLLSQPFVTLFDGQPMKNILDNIFGENSISQNIKARCVNIETSYALADAGVGIALLPESVVDGRRSNIRLYYPKNCNETRKIYALLPGDEYKSGYIDRLVQMMRENHV